MSKLIRTEVEERIELLLSQMTIEEKIGQTNQIHSFNESLNDTLRQGKIGSIINASGALTGAGQSPSARAEICNIIQRIAVNESRLGIPILFGRDVIHGYRTIFPIPLGQAASWNADLIEEAARIAAREASSDGIKWTFAPMIDITRDPRWGRVAEGPGEDPYLGSRLASAMVRGFQGNDFSQPDKLIACAKHFVGYGAAEGGRDYDNAEISMPTLQEVYLPPYQAAVNEGVGTVMAAFHDLNGTPMSCNSVLLKGLLKQEFGFNGFVVSDWESVAELVNHGVAANRLEAAALGLKAGVDMDMVSQLYAENLMECLNDGKIDVADLDNAVRRILRIKILAGLFDRPYTDETRAANSILTPEHRSQAKKLAHQAMVLLKNQNSLLPLDRHRKIAVVGPLVHASYELFGTWAPDGRREEVKAISDALLENAPPNTWLRFAQHTDDALRLAGEADIVVVIVGESPNRSGENANVAHLGLPPGQSQLIQEIAILGKPIVLIVLSGRPLAIPQEVALSQAVLFGFHPGTEGGAALADILFGYETPAAKLPITIPRSTGQVPVYYNHKNSGRPAGQGMFLSRYVDSTHIPLFPFGFGLSYTHFSYSDLQISSSTMKHSLKISATITNTGSRPGAEIVQLYIRDLIASTTRPVKQLKGFQRIFLKPRETQQVQFELKPEDLVFYDRQKGWTLEPGEFKVWVGPNSSEGLEGSFTLV